MRARASIAVAALALLVGAGVLVFRRAASVEVAPGSAPMPPAASASASSSAGGGGAAVGVTGRPGPSAEELTQLAAFFRERYGARLASPSIQLRMLEKLLHHFQERFPGAWEEALLAFLRSTFPERAAELEVQLRRWLAYERWMRENEGYLLRLGAAERRENVWAERERLWGDAAKDIWASELQHQAEADALAALDASPGVPLPERVARYKESLASVHGEQAAAYVERHRQEVLNRFLDLGSVQQELAAQSPGERARSLRTIREGLGLDAAALERWDTLDRTRDARWEAGTRYMAEREALAQQYTGAQLERRVAELRQRTFGAEADTVAAEEEAGFFRFSRPRVWGRN
ncbi:MAG: hypothetical protein L0Y64_23550 [Myxococcaceae bacterium]|nr:hypothetical protein [Myxococcaceae bacterium]